MSLLIGFLFRKILFWLLTTLGFSLLRMLIDSGLKKTVDARDKLIREIVRMVVGLLTLAIVIGLAMLIVRILIVVFYQLIIFTLDLVYIIEFKYLKMN